MRIGTTTLILLFLFTALAATASAEEVQLSPKEKLGKLLYFDENLSTPNGQSCASCHDPESGFAEPDQSLPVSQGVLPNMFGNRNAPSAAYASYSPNFNYTPDTGGSGGQFWDGRADNLTEQAKGPFLNPLEMHNPNKLTVIQDIRISDYADLFEEVYGSGALDDVETAYDYTAEAIAAYESSKEVNKFSSRYDEYLAGEYTLSDDEAWGLDLFEGKAMCSNCHPSARGPDDELPLFTNFTYDNLGVPKNPDNPFYNLPKAFNPLGSAFIDLGLGGSGRTEIVYPENEVGKMKVPTLRNIGKTAPYTHNGYFTNLEELVHFYNTRDVEDWPAPEVPETVNEEELGDLGLNESEEKAIVAFLLTLDDK